MRQKLTAYLVSATGSQTETTPKKDSHGEGLNTRQLLHSGLAEKHTPLHESNMPAIIRAV